MDPSLQEAAGSPRLRAGLVALPGTCSHLPAWCTHSYRWLSRSLTLGPARLSLQPQGLCSLLFKTAGVPPPPSMPTFRLFPSLLGLRHSLRLDH